MCIGYVQILCHLYKRLENPPSLISVGGLGNNPLWDTEGPYPKYNRFEGNALHSQSEDIR